MKNILAQWNYYQLFMNGEISDLPPPALFLSERESIRESFLYCLNEFGFTTVFVVRIMVLPAVLILAFFRVIGLWTCREPIWPDHVRSVSLVEDEDKYNQPSGLTPVGWESTGAARDAGSYPLNPKRSVENWLGESDAIENAKLWETEIPPVQVIN